MRGFRFGAVAAGLKAAGALDVGVIVAPRAVSAAGVFTTNRVVAAPVVQSRSCLQRLGRARAIVVNSGNANACTGDRGRADASRMAELVASELGCASGEVLVCSTGVIGAFLPMEKLERGVPAALQSAGPDLTGFADAILTTDTRRKIVEEWVPLPGGAAKIAGCAKGAGMIHPHMATLLAFVLTDAALTPEDLDVTWRAVCGRTFNAITVDGDTSTNDAAIVLAGGEGPPLRGADLAAFAEGLEAVARRLARLIVRDAEGATKCVAVTVRGAASEADARRAADTVAQSPLVKTALHGEDPNWGRVVAALGRSGACFDPEAISVSIGGARVFHRGCPEPGAEPAAQQVMRRPEYELIAELSAGDFEHTVWTCDLSASYVRINADYRS